MNPALLYLLLRTMRGRIVRALRLLKQPKYLIGIGGFVAWMLFWVGGPLFFSTDRDELRSHTVNADFIYRIAGDALPTVQLIVALMVVLFVSLWWLLPWGRLALKFNESEVHMLTPMPVRRRHLIQYATLKSQPGILFGCLMMTIFMGTGGPPSRVAWYMVFWMYLSLWDLHSKARSLWFERQRELPRARAWRNHALLVAAIVVYWIVLSAALAALVGQLAGMRPETYQDAVEYIRELLARVGPELRSGILSWLLAPFLWVTALLFAAAPGTSLGTRLLSAGFVLALLVVHNEWVVRSQVKFEDAALAHARREAGQKQSGARYWRRSVRSRRSTSFPLAPVGRPETAILWKNAMIVTRVSLRRLALLAVAAIALCVGLTLALSSLRGLGFIFLSIGSMTMLLTPLAAAQNYRNDLRADLLRLEMVRTWPIEGWRLFSAEIAGPVSFSLITLLLSAGLTVAVSWAMMFNRALSDPAAVGQAQLVSATAAGILGTPEVLLPPLILAGALPLLVGLTCLSSALQNFVVLLFPGWVHLGSDRNAGAAAFGQNIVTFLGLGLASILSVLPAALIVAAIVAVQVWGFGLGVVAWEFPLFGLIGAMPVFTATVLVVRAGGRVWDGLDPSREVLEGGT